MAPKTVGRSHPPETSRWWWPCTSRVPDPLEERIAGVDLSADVITEVRLGWVAGHQADGGLTLLSQPAANMTRTVRSRPLFLGPLVGPSQPGTRPPVLRPGDAAGWWPGTGRSGLALGRVVQEDVPDRSGVGAGHVLSCGRQ